MQLAIRLISSLFIVYIGILCVYYGNLTNAKGNDSLILDKVPPVVQEPGRVEHHRVLGKGSYGVRERFFSFDLINLNFYTYTEIRANLDTYSWQDGSETLLSIIFLYRIHEIKNSDSVLY